MKINALMLQKNGHPFSFSSTSTRFLTYKLTPIVACIMSQYANVKVLLFCVCVCFCIA